MDSCLMASHKSTTPPLPHPKVTLTNWERLNNSPLLLPHCSAVQWNEYVFVLARDGTALLYHTKGDIWSALPKCNERLPTNGPPPLVQHKGQTLTMSQYGQVTAFSHRTCKWSPLPEYQLTLGQGVALTTAAMAGHNDSLCVATQETCGAGHNDPLCLGIQKTRRAGLKLATSQPEAADDNCVLHVYSVELKWEKVCDIQATPLHSAAMVGPHLYIQAGGRVHKVILLEKGCEAGTKPASPLAAPRLGGFGGVPAYVKQSLPTQGGQKVTPIRKPLPAAMPPYTDSTFYVVKDTLLAFGGRDEDNQPTSDVLRYNPDTDSWESAGYMRSARYSVAVATIQHNGNCNVYVIGGSFGSSQLKSRNELETNVQASSLSLGALSQGRSALGGGLVLGGPFLQCPSQSGPWACNTSIVESCAVTLD